MYDFTMRSSADVLRELQEVLAAMPDSPEKERRCLVLSYDKLPPEMQRGVRESLGYRRAYCISMPDPYGIGASLLPHIERLTPP